MFAALWDDLPYLHYIITSPLALIGFLFQAWMFIDALRRREWLWRAKLLCRKLKTQK